MVVVFFFNDTATTEIYTLSLHDALPISSAGRCATTTRRCGCSPSAASSRPSRCPTPTATSTTSYSGRSEEHTSELQSRQYLVCRLLLEKKKNNTIIFISTSILLYICSRS